MLSLGRTRTFSFVLLCLVLGACDEPAREPADGSSTSGTSAASETSPSPPSTGMAGTTAVATSTTEPGGGESSSSTGASSDADYDTSSSSGGDTSSETSDSSSSSSTGEAIEDIDTVCETGKRASTCELPSPYEAAGDCNPYAQDCVEGEKCLPWASDGGTAWDSTRCSPVPAVPDQLGDPCVVEESGVSGIDSCDVGLMCWDVDGETNTGSCIELCGCGPLQPTCAGGGTLCTISNDDVLPLCLPTCDPLDPEAVCSEGEGCYPVGDGFQCAPDASGDGGLAAQPCNFINACDPGSACVSPDLVPGCASAGCCTPFCDLDEPDTCPFGTCRSWFAEGEEPLECHIDTGVCAVD